MLQLGVCLPQAGAYMSQDTPEHPPDGTDPPGTPLMTKIRPKKNTKLKNPLKNHQWINKYLSFVTGKRRLGQIDEFTLEEGGGGGRT